MPTQRAPQRASPRAPKPERTIQRRVVKPQRSTPFGGADGDEDLVSTVEGGMLRAQQSRCSLPHPAPVPSFGGQEAGCEVGDASRRPWACKGAVRPVEPTADA